MKILIVEDEIALSEVLRIEFERADFETEVAADGEIAMAKLQSSEPLPDLVLLDLILPKKDGFAVLEEMKNDPKLKNVPTIIISNLDSDEDIKRTLALGAVDYFVKVQHPVMELVEKVKAYLLEPPKTRSRR
ncbi:MAG: response regulator [Patescibacteria group bacterium]